MAAIEMRTTDQAKNKIRNPVTREYPLRDPDTALNADMNGGTDSHFVRFFLWDDVGNAAHICKLGGSGMATRPVFLPEYIIPDGFSKKSKHLSVGKLSWHPGLGMSGEAGTQFRIAWMNAHERFGFDKDGAEESKEVDEDDDDDEQMTDAVEKPRSAERSEDADGFKASMLDVDGGPENALKEEALAGPRVKRAKCVYRAFPLHTKLGVDMELRRISWRRFTDKATLHKRKLFSGWKVELGDGKTWKIEPGDKGVTIWKDETGNVMAEEFKKSTQVGFVGVMELALKTDLGELEQDFLVSVWIARIAAELGVLGPGMLSASPWAGAGVGAI